MQLSLECFYSRGMTSCPTSNLALQGQDEKPNALISEYYVRNGGQLSDAPHMTASSPTAIIRVYDYVGGKISSSFPCKPSIGTIISLNPLTH
jgi:hypothetical protein